MSNPAQELHTERRAPEQSPVEESAVDTILLHSPAVSFSSCPHDASETNVVEIPCVQVEELFIIGATATATHCESVKKEEEEKKKKVGSIGVESSRETSHWLHMLDFICQIGSGVVGTG